MKGGIEVEDSMVGIQGGDGKEGIKGGVELGN